MYPTIFNIVVDAVVRATLTEVYTPQDSQHVLGWETGDQVIVFYADGGRIAGRNPIWIQGTLDGSIPRRHLFYMGYNCSEIQICTLIFSTNFYLIFIFK